MLTLNQIHAQIEALANAHYQIAEVGMGTLAELQAKPDRLYPLLWLSNEGGSLEDNYKVDNIRLTMFGRVISGEEGQDDDASEIEVLSDMQLILLDFLNYFHQQHAQEYVVAKSASLEHFTERTNDRTAGYSCILELKQFYNWNKCQIPESGASISPSVDGLTLYDFCDQAVIDRLTPTQVACLEDEFGGGGAPATLTVNSATFTTVASGGTLDIAVHDTADANVGTVASTSEIEIGNSSNEVNGVDISEPTVAEGTHNQEIQNSAATPVGTAANPSVIGDSQAQVNGANTETIPATVTHNQLIQDSAGADVGTAANPSVISDASVTVNSSAFDTVVAEGTINVPVQYENGTPTGTISGGVVEITNPVTPPSLTVALTDSLGNPATTADYGETIRITATPSFTPTSYLIFAKSSNDVTHFIYEGTDAFFDWFVNVGGDTYDIYVVADDTVNSLSAYNTASITVSAPLFTAIQDFDALFSLRRLNLNYSGVLLNIRRASDNAETYISLDDGMVDVSAIETFCSGTDGFVVEWFSQAIYPLSVYNFTEAEQPKIYDSATGINLENGKPALKFDGVNDSLSTGARLLTDNVWYANAVCNVGGNGGSTREEILGQFFSGINNRMTILSKQASTTYLRTFFNNGSSRIGVISEAANVHGAYVSQAYGDDYYLSKNTGTVTEVITAQAMTPVNYPFSIGNAAGSFSNGNIQEVIVDNANQSANHSTIVTNQVDYYGI